MMKIALIFSFLVSFAHAYVPTVESLFRHGSNPDVSANGISLTFIVKKMGDLKPVGPTNDTALVQDTRPEDYYRIFLTNNPNQNLKVAQTRYKNGTFSESSLEHKTYYPNFTAYTIKPDVEQLERGLFFGLIQSLALNDGSHIVNYLKNLGVPVRLNNELLNREKVEFLAEYKRYLATISRDRNAKKTEVNPMRPEDPVAREKAEQIMNEAMYVDTKQVKLSREDGQVSWVVNAGPFEAVFSYKVRDLQRIRYKSEAGEIEMICKDYWLANGTHSMPRYVLIKGLNGLSYQVEITNLRHYVEKEDDLIRRLKNWDDILKGKESTELRPEFLL